MQDNLLDLLKGQLGNEVIGQVTQQLGINGDQAQSAISTLLPTLLGGLTKNVSNEQGAASLWNALDRDHDGSMLNDLVGMAGRLFTNGSQENHDGNRIADHILADKRGAIEESVSEKSGIGLEQVGQILTFLGPIVLGFLGKKKKEEGLDVSSLAGLLTNQKNTIAENGDKKTLGMLGFLDRDGDGNVVDDVMDIGGELLRNFLKK